MNSFSWILNPLLRNERILHFSMVVLMILAIIGGFYIQRGIAHCVEEIGADREECIRLCLLETEYRDALQKAHQENHDLEASFRDALGRIPNVVVDAEVLKAIRAAAGRSSCTLGDFRPTITQTNSEFQTRSFELHLEGSFQCIVRFSQALQEIPFAYEVGRFKISEPTKPGSMCRFEMELKVVFDHLWSRPEQLK